MANRLGHNPWVTKAMTGKVAQAFDEQGVYFEELQRADEKPIIICPNGHRAYFKPSVGTWVCTCGMLLGSNDEWLQVRYPKH